MNNQYANAIFQSRSEYYNSNVPGNHTNYLVLNLKFPVGTLVNRQLAQASECNFVIIQT